MRPAIASIAIALLAALPGSLGARSSIEGVERQPIKGIEYVRLADWAAANRFEVHWDETTELLRLAGRWSELIVSPDSRRSAINGVTVFLSWPVVQMEGVLYLAADDVRKTIDPVLFPVKYPEEKRVRTICIDPGHGGKDPGHVEGGNQEKSLTLLLARELAGQLREAGFNVVLTRDDDRFVDLFERPDIARRGQADLFISVHYNAAPRQGVKGVEVYCLPPAGAASTSGDVSRVGPANGNEHDQQNMLLAYQIQRVLLSRLSMEDRGVKRARFAVLREAQMPAVLVEAGFMSHPEERNLIYDEAHRRETARAILDGIVAYQRLIER